MQRQSGGSTFVLDLNPDSISILDISRPIGFHRCLSGSLPLSTLHPNQRLESTSQQPYSHNVTPLSIPLSSDVSNTPRSSFPVPFRAERAAFSSPAPPASLLHHGPVTPLQSLFGPSRPPRKPKITNISYKTKRRRVPGGGPLTPPKDQTISLSGAIPVTSPSSLRKRKIL